MNIEYMLDELRGERTRIDQAIRAIEAIVPGGARRPTAAPKTRRRSRMSTTARKRLSQLMKKRWASGRMKGRSKAKVRRNATKSTRRTPANQAKATAGMTAAGRRRLSDLMKKRWAERKKTKGTTA